MRRKLISIIAPVYNEAAVIEDFHQHLIRTLQGLSNVYNFEVIYVLDRSTDNSKDCLTKLVQRDLGTSRVIALSRRFGHQMSLVAGIDVSHGDAIIMLDSDLQHPPELIPEFLTKYEGGCDIVQAVRIDEQEPGCTRKLLSHLFYRALNRLTPITISANAPDFRLISRKVAD